jgi:PAS domain S-box-containing protein
MTTGPRAGADARARADSSEARIDAIEEAARLGTWLWSRSSGTLRLSRGLYRILRMDPESPPLSSDLITTLIHDDDRAALAEQRRAIFTGRGPTVHDTTYRLVLAHGAVRRYAERAEAQSMDSTGLALTVLGVVRDVTGDEPAGEAQDSSSAPSPSALAAMLGHAAVGMGLTDANSRWTRVNAALCAFLGYSEAELLQRSERRLIHPDDAAADTVEFRRLFSGDIPSYAAEQRYIHRDGHVLVGVVNKTLIRDASGIARQALVQIYDVTERVEALAASGFLNEAAQLLALSLEPAGTLHTIARLAVPRLADWCVIDLVHPTLGLCTVESLATTPETETILRELRERYVPLPFEVDDPRRRVLGTGRSSIVTDVSRREQESPPRGAEHVELLRRLGQTASMIVPLAARGRVTGAITLGQGDSKRRFNQAGLRTAEQFATLAALAIDNARLYDAARPAITARGDVAPIAALKAIDHVEPTPLSTGLEHLSERERKVFALSARGHTAAEIGEKLFLSPKTVETYRARAMRKLGLETRSEVVALAIRAGLLDSI